MQVVERACGEVFAHCSLNVSLGKKEKKKAENKQIHHLQCVLPKKKFVLQPESRTTCELKELLHNANTNELLSPPRAEPRGTGRGGERLHLSEENQG